MCCSGGGAHGCNPCKAASGAPVDEIDADGAGPPKPFNASAWSDIINRFAACLSASRSSAVCLLWEIK